MKKVIVYLFSVILSLLLAFSCMGAACSVIVRFQAMEAGICKKLIVSRGLAQTVSDQLGTYFRQQENTTGIPFSVYAPYVSTEAVEPLLLKTVENGFDYLNSRDAVLGISPDFSGLEQDIRAYFEAYAAENDIPQDQTYETVLKKTVDSAEQKILQETDIYRIAVLNDAGLVKTVRKYCPLAGWAVIGTLVLCVVLFGILMAVHHAQPADGIYWTATAVLTGSVLLLAPALWLKAEDWFARFSIKSDAVFSGVTGFLYALTDTVILTAAGGIVLAAVLYLCSGLMRSARNKKETIQKARH